MLLEKQTMEGLFFTYQSYVLQCFLDLLFSYALPLYEFNVIHLVHLFRAIDPFLCLLQMAQGTQVLVRNNDGALGTVLGPSLRTRELNEVQICFIILGKKYYLLEYFLLGLIIFLFFYLYLLILGGVNHISDEVISSTVLSNIDAISASMWFTNIAVNTTQQNECSKRIITGAVGTRGEVPDSVCGGKGCFPEEVTFRGLI